MEEKWWQVQFPGPAGVLELQLESKLYLTEKGFGRRPSVYGVTITQARYGGSYEGGGIAGDGAWLCFPVGPGVLDHEGWRGWEGSDIECAAWWRQAAEEGWPIGHGGSPGEAYENFLAIVMEKTGVTREDLAAAPAWPKPRTPGTDES